MVASKTEMAEEDGKTELDLGIEDSIRRCEALLAMVPMSLQASLANVALYGSSKAEINKVARTYLDLDLEAKMRGLEPEWIKNMGLLSSISMSRAGTSSSSSRISRRSDSLNSETPTQEYATEKEETKIRDLPPVAHAYPVTYSPKLMGARSPQRDVIHSQRRHMRRRCASGSNSSVAEDWTAYVSPVGTSRSSLFEDEHHPFKHFEDVSNKTSSESGESEKSIHCSVESPPKEDVIEKQSSTSMASEDKPNPEKVTHIAVPFRPPMADQQQDEEESLDEVHAHQSTHPDFVHSDWDSRCSQPTFETLCFTFSTPQHCEEAWDWFDKRIDSSPASLYEARPQREKDPSWRPESNTSEQTQFPLPQNKNAAELKPKGLPTNYKRSKSSSLKEDWRECYSKEESRNCRNKGNSKPGKVKMQTMASMTRLAVPKTAMYYRLAQAKTMREAERLSECSFKPTTLGRKPEPGSKFSAPIVERLGDMRKRIDFRKRARKLIEKEERDQCSFWPKINLQTNYLDMGAYQPIQQRLQELLRKRDKKISQARAQEARDRGLTFKPVINPNSARILKQRAKSAPTVDTHHRLHSNSPRISEGSQDFFPPQAKQAKFLRPKNVCTFAPEINPNTDDILAGTTLEGCDFLSRQHQFNDRVEQRKRSKEQEVPVDFTFQPKSGNAAFILSCSPMANTNDENLAERCDRLSYRDSQRRLYIRQRISDNYYAQFAFQPQIDETSRALGRPATVQNLFVNESGKQHMEEVELKAQEEFQKTCTFRAVRVYTPRKDVEGILEHRRRTRQEKAKTEEEERVLRELEELSQCTFKPMTNPLPPKETECVRIKGLRRHLELQGLAKQMKKDQEEWEKKVFISHTSDLPRRQYTIPKPFALNTPRPRGKGCPPARPSGPPSGSNSPRLHPCTPCHSCQSRSQC